MSATRASAGLCAIALFGGCAVLGPVALGGTPPSVGAALDVAVACAVATWALFAAAPARLSRLPLAAAALASLQLLPLPASILGWVAPPSARIWAAARGDSPAWGTISVDPHATAAAIRQVFLGLATVVAVSDLCRDPRCRRLLTASLVLSALVIWGLAIAFPRNPRHVLLGSINLGDPRKDPDWWLRTSVVRPEQTSGAGLIDRITVGDAWYPLTYWSVGDGTGSYVVSNHFAGGMALTVPVLLGAILAWSQRWLPRPAGITLAWVVFAAATWTVFFAAGSRAGGAAMFMAALVFATLACRTVAARRLWAAATGSYALFLATAVVAFFGAIEVPDRLVPGLLRPGFSKILSDGRQVFTASALRMFRASPLVGMGLGTYRSVQPRIESGGDPTAHAHDDYAELLGETGFLGSLGLAALSGIILSTLRLLLRRPPESRLVAAGAWAALAAIALHSLFDWNMHVPANALMTCLLAGLVFSEGKGEAVSDSRPEGRARRLRSGVALALACLVVALFSIRDAWAESTSRSLRESLDDVRFATSEPARASAIEVLRHATEIGESRDHWNPADADRAVLLAEAHLHLAAAGELGGKRSAEEWFRGARSRAPLVAGLPSILAQ
ncbi:MAG: hypothetical protein RL698_3094 [Pseudomonadota bacterium]